MKGVFPRLLQWWEHHEEKEMAILQAILDAQAKLDAAVAANSAKVDALIASGTGGATVAEQQTIADAINASAAAVETTNAKS